MMYARNKNEKKASEEKKGRANVNYVISGSDVSDRNDENPQQIYYPQQPEYSPQKPAYSPQQPAFDHQQPAYNHQQPTYIHQQPVVYDYQPQMGKNKITIFKVNKCFCKIKFKNKYIIP
jgi:hypothetical protein